MPFVSQDDAKPERQSEPVVSVVMAAYNYDQYIGQAIQFSCQLPPPFSCY